MNFCLPSLIFSWTPDTEYDFFALLDKLTGDSLYPKIEQEISIGLKRNKTANAIYFIRYTNSKQIAVISKENSNEVLIGEESLEEILTVSLMLTSKTSWLFKGWSVMLSEVIISIGYADHGINSTSEKIAMIEVFDMRENDQENTHLLDLAATYLGNDLISSAKTSGKVSTDMSMRSKQWVASVSTAGGSIM